MAPGGTLVVLGHHPDNRHTGLRNDDLADLLLAPDTVTVVLDPDGWDVGTAAAVTREHVRDGRVHVVTDTVVRAVRRS